MVFEAKHETYRNIVASYCEVLEASSETPAKALLAIRDALITLYLASLDLPIVPNPTDEDLPTDVSSEEFSEIKKKIDAYTRDDYFWICYHPFQSPPEKPLCVSLSDSLADIWRDLKPGLLALAEDEQRFAANVFWEWKFSFDSHWGDHAADSIWAIHKLLRDSPHGQE